MVNDPERGQDETSSPKAISAAGRAPALPAVSRIARAQGYPSRAVRLILPYGPGNAPDIVARLIGQWLSERLSQQIIIDNRPGAGTNIGTEAAMAVTTATPSSALPDIPSVGDFVPGYEASSWHGLGVPKNTPAEVVEKLNKEIDAGLANPRLKARIPMWVACRCQ